MGGITPHSSSVATMPFLRGGLDDGGSIDVKEQLYGRTVEEVEGGAGSNACGAVGVVRYRRLRQFVRHRAHHQGGAGHLAHLEPSVRSQPGVSPHAGHVHVHHQYAVHRHPAAPAQGRVQTVPVAADPGERGVFCVHRRGHGAAFVACAHLHCGADCRVASGLHRAGSRREHRGGAQRTAGAGRRHRACHLALHA